MKREITMDGADALAMLTEIDKQDDVRVAKILRTRWTLENSAFSWESARCATCQCELFAGDVGHVWGKPLTNEPDCETVSMILFCSNDKCVERAMEVWAYDLKKDVMAAYFGDFGNDDLDLEH